MAVNESRSMNADMKQGAKDGVYKHLTPNRGGVVELKDVIKRADELQMQYSIATPEHPTGCPCGYC